MTMKGIFGYRQKIIAIAVAVVMLGAASIGSAGAADEKKQNVVPAEATGVATGMSSPASLALLSAQLARYGDEKKDAMTMIVAARLLVESGALAKELSKTSEGKNEAEAKPKQVIDGSVAGLLERAKKYAGDRKDLIALADDVAAAKSKGRIKPAGAADVYMGTTVVKARTTDVIKVSFRGGETAVVGVSGDGDTDLDLYIYDENGNVVASSTAAGDDEIVRWRPRWTGEFAIKVMNRGTTANRYTLMIN
jgi:hypothetical protein